MSPWVNIGSSFFNSAMVRPWPGLVRNSMGAKRPLPAALLAFLAVLGAFAALAATSSTVLAAKAALSCRFLIGFCTYLRLLLYRVQMCALLSSLDDLCLLSDKRPKRDFWAKAHVQRTC